MGLAPIPASLCKHKATFKVYAPTSDVQKRYQEFGYQPLQEMENVHVQLHTTILKGLDNTEVQLKGTIFIDPTRTEGANYLPRMQRQSLLNGKPMRVMISAPGDIAVGDYEVLEIDALPDVPSDRIHHYEVLLV